MVSQTTLTVDPLQQLADKLTINEAAELLGVGTSTIWRWTLKGIRGFRLQTLSVGGRRFVVRDTLRDFMLKTSAAANGEPLPTTPVAARRARERMLANANQECQRAGI